jgi:hypothetical protein
MTAPLGWASAWSRDMPRGWWAHAVGKTVHTGRHGATQGDSWSLHVTQRQTCLHSTSRAPNASHHRAPWPDAPVFAQGHLTDPDLDQRVMMSVLSLGIPPDPCPMILPFVLRPNYVCVCVCVCVCVRVCVRACVYRIGEKIPVKIGLTLPQCPHHAQLRLLLRVSALKSFVCVPCCVLRALPVGLPAPCCLFIIIWHRLCCSLWAFCHCSCAFKLLRPACITSRTAGTLLLSVSADRDLIKVGVNVTASRKKRNFKRRPSQCAERVGSARKLLQCVQIRATWPHLYFCDNNAKVPSGRNHRFCHAGKSYRQSLCTFAKTHFIYHLFHQDSD